MNNTTTPYPPLEAWLDGVGLLGPGLADWPQASAVLRGQTAYTLQKTVLPVPLTLHAAERRRAAPVVKLTLAVGLEAAHAAGLNPAQLPTVFTSSGGDNHNCHAICAALASDDRLISPTRFHNSVHNAASGYWGIATGAMEPSAVLCAYDGCFAAGLLEALTQVALICAPVLLLAYDSDYPEPLHAARPIPDSLGVALALSPRPGPRSLARIALDAASPCSDAPADTLDHPQLEALRRTIPAARALPLLQALALRTAGMLRLDYLPGQALVVDVAPC